MTKKQKSKKQDKPQHDFILLDRTGSMAPIWAEALGSVNGYVKKLSDDKVPTKVTLAVFDRNGDDMSFDVVRDSIAPKDWTEVTNKDASPRGMTPLNDAIGKLVTLANKGENGTQYDKAALIIMTDGAENSSREYSHTAAKKMLDDCRAKNWQVIFLGANFDNAAQAVSFGTSGGQTVNSSARNLRQTMQSTASLRASYGITGQSMNFSDEEKEKFKQQ